LTLPLHHNNRNIKSRETVMRKYRKCTVQFKIMCWGGDVCCRPEDILVYKSTFGPSKTCVHHPLRETSWY